MWLHSNEKLPIGKTIIYVNEKKLITAVKILKKNKLKDESLMPEHVEGFK